MNATVLINQAMGAFSDRRPDEAVALLERALELEPENVYALSNLGNLLLLGRDPVAAEQRFRSALAIDPEHVAGALGLGKALISQKRLDEALPPIQSVRDRVSPEQQGEFFQLIGVIFAGKQDWDTAITFFEKYAEHRPGEIDPVLCLQKAHLGKGDTAGAAAHMERAVELAPGQTPLWVHLVALYHELKLPQAMREACARMIAAHPDDLALHNLAVRLLREAGEYAYAARFCRRAIDRSPGFDRSQFIDLDRMESLL